MASISVRIFGHRESNHYQFKLAWLCQATTLSHTPREASSVPLSPQVWPLGREINCKCLKTLTVSEDRSVTLQPRLQFDGRYIVCSSDLGVYQWDFSSFEIIRYLFFFLFFLLLFYVFIFVSLSHKV